MLSKESRKKFLEQDFKRNKEKDTNWPQTRTRLRIKVKTTFMDLTRLAEKLPEEEQKELFTPEIIQKLLTNILFSSSPGRKPDARRTKIASQLISIGIEKCKTQYEYVEDHEPLRRQNDKILYEAKAIASSISEKVKIESIKE